ncbi:MAG: phosphotransferase [Proteobacteria bacterium]|nr:phosphotransferase [Pseudomonadota bacterium]
MVQIDNRFGIIFDRIEGRDMDSELISGLWTRLWKLRDYTRFFEDVQSRIHTESAPDNLISQHGLLEDSLSRSGPLPKRMRDAAVEALGRLPERGQLCHGDCHFGNVMLSAKGPAIIDWQNGNAGNPLGDMASTEILLLVPIVPPVLFPMVLPITKKRAAMYRHYCQKRPWFDEEEYRMHLFVAAAARIGNVFYNPKAVRYLLKTVESLYKSMSRP